MVVKIKTSIDSFDNSLQIQVVDAKTHEVVFYGALKHVHEWLQRKNMKYVMGTSGLWADV
jgi:hypothetical protein